MCRREDAAAANDKLWGGVTVKTAARVCTKHLQYRGFVWWQICPPPLSKVSIASVSLSDFVVSWKKNDSIAAFFSALALLVHPAVGRICP